MRKGLIRSQQQVPYPQWYSKLELCFGSCKDFSVNADEAEVSPWHLAWVLQIEATNCGSCLGAMPEVG